MQTVHTAANLIHTLSVSLCYSMASVEQVTAVGQVLVDQSLDLTQRFRALFTLKNLGGKICPQNTLLHDLTLKQT